jgi:hypothetical protein
VCGVENRGVRRDYIRAQDLPPEEILKIVFEVLQDKRRVADQSAQELES